MRSDRARPAAIADVPVQRPGGGLVTIRVFPADRRLADDVGRVAANIVAGLTDGADLQERLQAGLRAWYPRLTIHERTEFGALDRSETLWYVLRDGRVHPEDPRIDRLHAALAGARDVTEDAAEALDRARALTAVTAGSARRDARDDAADTPPPDDRE